jgi:hypothetical protein
MIAKVANNAFANFDLQKLANIIETFDLLKKTFYHKNSLLIKNPI